MRSQNCLQCKHDVPTSRELHGQRGKARGAINNKSKQLPPSFSRFSSSAGSSPLCYIGETGGCGGGGRGLKGCRTCIHERVCLQHVETERHMLRAQHTQLRHALHRPGNLELPPLHVDVSR